MKYYICEHCGNIIEYVRRWVMRYKQFGPEVLIVKHGSYDGAFKISVIEYMHQMSILESKTTTVLKYSAITIGDLFF